ncbi:MAG TPA: rhomboid family intramembrane serine protease, partial [Kofleriaceae bacterium]|nr:rhomboid family intramembrane serine protease [Kofleriaceae bacterium]
MPRIRISYNAPVVLTFTLLAVGVFIVNSVVSHAIIPTWFMAKPELHHLSDYPGLVTHILGHASWQHLLGNFMLILLVGPMLEERYGSAKLLGMILATALVTGLVNLAFFNTGLIGASGIVFMMILLASTANIRQGEIPLTFIAVAVIYLGGEIVRAVRDDDQISQMAHLIGGVVGAVFGFVGARLRPAAGGQDLKLLGM